ncbi:carboxypeptidase regulatory-like domain-containing protein [Okeania sp. SIO1I7]|uniref:carboxypeptidase regulatory-like domain-containing protein n=1 Tax=Okeania sp. SIO1I7 TaxID=2607772 RepID=UPI0013FC74B0|nr:carboxypeptidase regulatory-like domain-containing protein [Okeania sp. SIO1I7]NET26934.1 carboxypeptidase-like regulatory domain-containing protein [Okeania sp. SIO1I7]
MWEGLSRFLLMMNNFLNYLNNLPGAAKFLGIFIVAVLLTIAVFLGVDLPNSEPELIQVNIIVQTDSDEPIPGVNIQVISKGAPVNLYTDSNGYARVEIPSRGDVDVVLSKDGYERKKETIDLAVDPNRNRIFRLNKKKGGEGNTSEKKIKYQHLTTQNDFGPLALSILKPDLNIPMIQNVFSDALGIKSLPFVYKNPVEKTVEKFQRETGNKDEINKYVEAGVVYEYEPRNSKIEAIVPDKDDKNKVVSFSLSENRYNHLKAEGETVNGGSFFFAPIIAPIQTDKSNAQYTSFVSFTHGEGKSIFQYPKLGDLKGLVIKDEVYKSPINDLWIKKIMTSNPNNRGFLAFSYPYFQDDSKVCFDCECGSGRFGISSWSIFRYTPSPYLKFIDIENNTESALTIESVKFKLFDSGEYKLTVADERSSLFRSIPDKEYETNLVLKTGRHLLIPIEFGFSTEPHKNLALIDVEDSEKKSISRLNKLYIAKSLSVKDIYSVLAKNISDQQKTEVLMESKSFSNSFIKQSTSIGDLLESMPERFAVGPVIEVTAIKIDGDFVTLRPPGDQPSIYISKYFEGGSCPYLTIYDYTKNTWFDLGTVLYNRHNKNLQGEEIHILGNSNITKLRLEEREKEITFIDSITIKYIDNHDGLEHEVNLNEPNLNSADGVYMQLFEGDSFEIDLTTLIPSESSNIRLKINGYYQPTI